MHANSFRPPDQQEHTNPLILPWLMFLLIVHGWASMIHPLVRTNFGPRYFGFRQFFGFVVLWMFVGHNVHPDNYGIFIVFTALVFVMMFKHASHANRSENFMREYPNYDGLPIVMRFASVGEVAAKGIVEPLFILFVGITLYYGLDQHLGIFLMIGAGMSMFDFGRGYDKQMVVIRRMHDAESKMKYHSQLYNDFKKGRR